MGIIDQLLLPPSAQHLKLGVYLIYFMLLCLMPYLGALFVTSGLSLSLHKGYPEQARALRKLGFFHPAAMAIFGLLPVVTLAFLLAQFLYSSGVPVGDYMERVASLFVGSFGLLYGYARKERPLLGGLGVLLLGLGIFFLVSVLDLIYHPGFWDTISTPLPWLFSWSVVVHVAQYLVAGHLVAGVAILFLYFRWPETSLSADFKAAGPLRFWGLGLTLGAALVLPLLVLWDLGIAPDTALTSWAFVAGIGSVVLLFAVALMAVSMLAKGDVRHASSVLVLAALVFGLLLVKHQQLQVNANKEHSIVLAMEAEKARQALSQEQQKLYATSEPDPELGKTIYNERCTACHAWDKRVVGPPYLDVLPKYRDNVEALNAFVREPVKINPDYPVMPNQGLNEREVLSVSAYLMSELAKQEGTHE
jgi:cytochrome c